MLKKVDSIVLKKLMWQMLDIFLDLYYSWKQWFLTYQKKSFFFEKSITDTLKIEWQLWILSLEICIYTQSSI